MEPGPAVCLPPPRRRCRALRPQDGPPRSAAPAPARAGAATGALPAADGAGTGPGTRLLRASRSFRFRPSNGSASGRDPFCLSRHLPPPAEEHSGFSSLGQPRGAARKRPLWSRRGLRSPKPPGSGEAPTEEGKSTAPATRGGGGAPRVPAKRGAGSPRIAHRPALRARAAHLSRLCRCHAEHGHERRGRGGARARLPLTCLGSMAPARHVRAARRRSPDAARPAPAVAPPALRSAAASVGMGTAGSRRRERRAGGGAAAPVFTFVSREGPPRGREAGLGRPQVRPDRPVLSRAPNARIPRRAHGDRAPRRPPRAPQGNRG